MAKLVMGYWDCPVCGSKGIAGTVLNCPSCGRARGDVKFYMKDVAEGEIVEENETGDIEYLSEEQEAQVGKSPDWYCSYCNSLNKDFAERCAVCGASREDSESNYFDQLKKRQEAEAAEQAARPKPAAAQAAPQKGGFPKWLLIAAALLIALFFWMNGNNTRGNLQVTDIGWVRSIPVEQYQPFQESGWSVPAGGETIRSYQAIHHYDQVLDHYENVERTRQVVTGYETYYTYEDNGNGSFSQVPHQRPVYGTETYTDRQPVYVPVARYATKYDYKIWRWVHVRDATVSGTDHEAAWPDTNLAEDEREGSQRQEAYVFTVQDEKGNKTTWRLAQEDWQAINPGDRLNITEKRSGSEAWITDDQGTQLARIYRR